MTTEEAIKELKEYYVWMNGKINGNPILEPIGIAISALEKQVPKKPHKIHDVDENGYPYYAYVCDECGNVIDEYEDDFCPNCGQAIDWSDYDDK